MPIASNDCTVKIDYPALPVVMLMPFDVILLLLLLLLLVSTPLAELAAMVAAEPDV